MSFTGNPRIIYIYILKQDFNLNTFAHMYDGIHGIMNVSLEKPCMYQETAALFSI